MKNRKLLPKITSFHFCCVCNKFVAFATKMKCTKLTNQKSLLSILLIIVSVGILNPILVKAQTTAPDLNLTIFPPTAYLTVKPGTSITHRIILKYEGTTRVKILPSLVDFTTDGLTGTPVLQNPSKIDYVKLQNSDKQLGVPFIIEPGSQQELVINIDPPLHAKTGEQPLSLILTATPDTKVVVDGSSAQASGAVASNIILSVQNDFDNKSELIIEKIQLPKIVDSFSSINFEILAKNVGRNAAAASGEVKLSHGWSGKELKKWYVYPDVILADATRQLRGLLINPDEIEPESEIAFEKFSYKPLFLIGPYEITAKISTANQANQANQTNQLANGLDKNSQKIIALPISIICLLGLGIGLYFLINKFNQKQTPS